MGLLNIVIPKKEIIYGKDEDGNALSFSIKGLSFEDVSFLVEESIDELDKAVSHLGEAFKGFDSLKAESNFNEFLSKNIDELIHLFPSLVDKIIAVAAGSKEKDDIEAIGSLSIDFQCYALSEIYFLTLGIHGGIKKLLSMVLMSVRPAMQAMKKENLSTGITTLDAQ